jgi:hypothetical protein
MNIKRINEMKMDEVKKAKEKSEREGSPLKKNEESKTGLLTEVEVYAKRIEEEEKGVKGGNLSEAQIKAIEEKKER